MENAEAKRSRVLSLLAVSSAGRRKAAAAAPLGGAAATQQQRQTEILFGEEYSLIPRTRAREAAERKRDRILAMLNLNPSPQKRNGNGRKAAAAAAPLRNGWFETGWPKRKVYTTAELVQWWKILWTQCYGKEPDSYGEWMFRRMWMRKHLLRWLKEDGHEAAEAVIEYAVRNWNAVRKRLAIDADRPELNIVYGYRRPLLRMMEAEEKGRKWAPDWSQERVYDETEVTGEVLF